MEKLEAELPAFFGVTCKCLPLWGKVAEAPPESDEETLPYCP